MSDSLPKGEDLRKAVRWVSQTREANPERSLATLLEEAGVKFDLSPRDENFLLKFFTSAGPTEQK